MGNKIYCHPLTIADSKSRFVFTAKGHYKEDHTSAKSEFKQVFRKYGIPKQIYTDNGSPFGSCWYPPEFIGICGYSFINSFFMFNGLKESLTFAEF